MLRLLYSLFSFVSMAFLLSACDSSIIYAGYAPNEGLMQSLESGKTSRAEALNALGEPSDIAPISSNDIYYVYQVSTFGGPAPEIEQQRSIVVLRFDDANILEKIETKNKDDGRSISIEGDITETPGVDRPNPLTDFFSGIGRFVPEE